MKVIAFYLPQFHEIPENDEFWGKGFTEWTNVRAARPLYEGHAQPVVPLHENYYDLTDIDVMRWQADLAHTYGVYGFCIYHYWIEGRKLLERPLENLLGHPEVDVRYCISWANHSWTDSWAGTKKMLIAQTYGGREDWDRHFDYLLPFFRDERYIRVDGKPLLLIFNPEDVERLNDMLDHWQERARDSGLPGLSFSYQNYYFGTNPHRDDSRFDFGVEHQPAYAFLDYRGKLKTAVRQYGYKFLSRLEHLLHIKMNMDVGGLERMDYERLWQCVVRREPTDDKRVAGAFSGWDNTPRKKGSGLVVENASPELFRRYMALQIARARDVYHKDMLFIAAWNEWAEGSMLEPDERHGYAYLEALRDALVECGEFPDE